jgi:hypothetical protein
MKFITNSIFYLLILGFSISNCQKFEPEPFANLPDSVELGKSVVYLNGELVDYQPKIRQLVPQFEEINIEFIEDNSRYLTHRLVLDTGKTYNHLTFFQSISDRIPHTYEPIDTSNYLLITELNRTTRTIQGKFYGTFERTSTGVITNNNNLPIKLLFQGVFHENY